MGLGQHVHGLETSANSYAVISSFLKGAKLIWIIHRINHKEVTNSYWEASSSSELHLKMKHFSISVAKPAFLSTTGKLQQVSAVQWLHFPFCQAQSYCCNTDTTYNLQFSSCLEAKTSMANPHPTPQHESRKHQVLHYLSEQAISTQPSGSFLSLRTFQILTADKLCKCFAAL